MLFRSNCVRPVYVVRGYDEGGHVVAAACVHDPKPDQHRALYAVFLGYGDVVTMEVSIETMKFDGWRVIG